MQIDVRQGPLVPIRTTNSTTAGTSINNPADTLTKPSGAGVVELSAGMITYGPPRFFLLPYGVGSDTNTFLMSVFGWDIIPGNGSTTADQWTAYLLASFTCTLSSGVTGVAGGTVPATSFYCNSIALGKGGTAGVSQEVTAPTGSVKAWCWVDTKGCQLIETLFAMNNSATSANALWRRF